jgi:hypothetical protein
MTMIVLLFLSFGASSSLARCVVSMVGLGLALNSTTDRPFAREWSLIQSRAEVQIDRLTRTIDGPAIPSHPPLHFVQFPWIYCSTKMKSSTDTLAFSCPTRHCRSVKQQNHNQQNQLHQQSTMIDEMLSSLRKDARMWGENSTANDSKCYHICAMWQWRYWGSWEVLIESWTTTCPSWFFHRSIDKAWWDLGTYKMRLLLYKCFLETNYDISFPYFLW